MTSLGLLCLLESDYFQHRKWSLAWGLVFGSALMLDRLTVLFYLGPACLYVFTKGALERTSVRYSILYHFHFFGCTIAYYREFSFVTRVSYCHKHRWVRLIQQGLF